MMIKKLLLLTSSLFFIPLLYSDDQAEHLIEQLISDCNIKIKCGSAKLNYKKMRAKKKKQNITKVYEGEIASAQAACIAFGACAVTSLGCATAFVLNDQNIGDPDKLIGLAIWGGLTLVFAPVTYKMYKKRQDLIKQKALELKLIDQRIDYYQTKIDMLKQQLKALLGKNTTEPK